MRLRVSLTRCLVFLPLWSRKNARSLLMTVWKRSEKKQHNGKRNAVRLVPEATHASFGHVSKPVCNCARRSAAANLPRDRRCRGGQGQREGGAGGRQRRGTRPAYLKSLRCEIQRLHIVFLLPIYFRGRMGVKRLKRLHTHFEPVESTSPSPRTFISVSRMLKVFLYVI